MQLDSPHLASFESTSSHPLQIYDLAWSSGDDLLASASSDFTAKVWDLSRTRPPGSGDGAAAATTTTAAGAPPAANLQHSCFVYTAAFQPDPGGLLSGRRVIVTGAFDCCVRLWDSASGELLRCVKVNMREWNDNLIDGQGIWKSSGNHVVRILVSQF